jgi:hypothetical protein
MLPVTTTTASKSPVSAVTHASLTLTAKTVTPWPWTVGSLLVFCGAPPVAVVGGVRYAILGSDSTSDALGYADPAALLIDPTDVQAAAVFDAKVIEDCGLSESTTITGTNARRLSVTIKHWRAKLALGRSNQFVRCMTFCGIVTPW